MAQSALHLSRHGAVLLLELRGPGGFPRLTRAVLAQLAHQLELSRTVSDITAIVLTGSDRCFAAGADLSEVSALTPLEAIRFAALGQALMNQIAASPKPVVAAIRGHCLGGGLDLAMACHYRVAARDAVLRHPGATLGLLTGWGGTQRLPRSATPRARQLILEALLAGNSISASEAALYGLVQRVTSPSQTLPEALRFAAAI